MASSCAAGLPWVSVSDTGTLKSLGMTGAVDAVKVSAIGNNTESLAAWSARTGFSTASYSSQILQTGSHTWIVGYCAWRGRSYKRPKEFSDVGGGDEWMTLAV